MAGNSVLGQIAGLSGGNVDEFLVRMGVETTGMRDEVHRTMQDLKRQVDAGLRGLGQVPPGGLPINKALDESVQKASLLGTLLKGVALGGITTIVSSLGLATKAAIDFDDSFTAVLKTINGSPAQIDKLKRDFRDLAEEMHAPVDSINAIGAAAAELGIPIENLKEVVRIAQQMGSVTDMSAEQAVTALGTLGQVLNVRVQDYNHLADAITALGASSVATESQIADIAEQSGQAAKTLGLSAQQALAFADATASVAGAAGSADNVLTRLYTSVAQLTGGTNSLGDLAEQAGVTTQKIASLAQDTTNDGQAAFQGIADKVGMTTDQLKELVKTATNWQAAAKTLGLNDQQFRQELSASPAKALTDLLGAIQNTGGEKRTQALKLMGLDDQRSINTILGLAGNIDKLNKALGESNAAWEKGGDLADEYAKKTANLGDQIAGFTTALHDQLITLGQQITPVLSKIVGWMTEELPKAAKTLGDLWNNYLAKPLGDLWGAAVKLGTALTSILFDWSPDGKGGQSVSLFQQIAAALGAIAEDGAKVVGFLSDMLANPIIAGAVKLAAALAGMNVALRAMRSLVGMGSGIGNSLFGGLGSLGGLVSGAGGLFGRGGPSKASQWGFGASTTSAEENIARTHMTAADTQMEAARLQQSIALGSKAAAAQQNAWQRFGATGPLQYTQDRNALGQFVSMPYNWRNNAGSNFKRGGYGVRNNGLLDMLPGMGPSTFLNSTPSPLAGGEEAMSDADRAANARMLTMSEGELAAQAKNGMTGALQRGLYSAKGAISSGLSLVSKAFWPLFIGDMIGNFAAQPIAGWIAQNTGWDRLKVAAQQGWIAGLGGLFKAMSDGSDAWVARQSFDLPALGGKSATTVSPDVARAIGVTPQSMDMIERATSDFDALVAKRQALDDAVKAGGITLATDNGGRSLAQMALRPGGVAGLTTGALQGIASSLKVGIPAAPTRPNSGALESVVNFLGSVATTPFGGAGTELLKSGTDPKYQADLASWRATVQDLVNKQIASRYDDVDAAINTALSNVLKARGVNVGASQLSGIGAGAADFLNAQAGNTAVPQAFLQFMTNFYTGGGGPLSTAATAGSGMNALSQNLQGSMDGLNKLGTWLQTQSQTPEFAFGQSLLSKSGAQAEAANAMVGTADQTAAARKPLIEAVLGAGATAGLSNDAMNQLWTEQIWPAFLYAEQQTGQDQRQKLADSFGADISQALKDGVPWEQIKQQYGPQLGALLYDGLGNQQQDVTTRLSQVIQDVFGDSIGAAGNDPVLQQKVVDQFNTLFGTSLQGSAGFKSITTAYVQSLHANLLQADADPSNKQAVEDYINQHIPQGVLTPDEIDKAISGGSGAGSLASTLAGTISTSSTSPEVGTAIVNSSTGFVTGVVTAVGSAQNTQMLQAAGANMWGQIATGVQNSDLLESIMHSKLLNLLGLFGSSPPRYGPLKHPALVKAGRNIMRQVQDGIDSTGGLGIPSVSFGSHSGQASMRAQTPQFASSPRGVARAAMAPGRGSAMSAAVARSAQVNQRTVTQHISVDQMTVLGPQDRSTLVRQFRFMSGE